MNRFTDVVAFLQSPAFEMLTYTAAIFVFLIIFYKILILLANQPQKLIDKNYYLTQLNSLRNTKWRTCFKIPKYILSIWVLAITGYSALLWYILRPVEPSLWYLKNYYAESFNYDFFIFYFQNGFYTRVFFVVYHFLLAALLLATLFGAFLLNHVATFAKLSFKNICNVTPNITVFKYLYISNIFLLGFVLFFFDAQQTFVLLTTFIIIFGYQSFIMFKNQLSFSQMFSYKQRILTFLFILLLFVVGMLFQSYSKYLPTTYEYRPLIAISDHLVMLPYSKTHSENVLFEDITVEITSPIFADEALIYYPDVEQIMNTNIKFFDASLNFLVVSQDQANLEYLIQTHNLNLEIQEFSQGYYIKNDSENPVLYNYYFKSNTFYIIPQVDANISNTLNKLKIHNKLRNPFVIWSLDSHVIIKDEYNK